MDEKSDEILEHIETQRNELGANLNELETRVRQTTDWRAHFDRNPMLMLGATLGGGIMLGAMVGGTRSRSSGSYTASRHFTGAEGGKTPSLLRQRGSETIEHMKTALMAFATAKAKEFMNQALPGFDNYLRDAESKGSQPGNQGGDFSAGASPKPAGAYGQSEYGQQNYGGEYGKPVAGQQNYSSERERAGSGTSNYGNT